MIRVGVGEEQVELAGSQLARDLRALLFDLLLQLGIVLRKLIELDQVARAALELVPRIDELAVSGRFTRQVTCAGRVVPDAGLGQEPVELLGADALGRKVKDAP